MPYYNFDLVVGHEHRTQGGLILENIEVASDRANQLATELRIVYPELQDKGCAVRVTGYDDTEVYRTPLDQSPSWLRG
ncbi:hypothetical protein [Bradyrhizobium zhanjiangense]|uniref:hypothetical protein n=1 Tax=Bradyrhizobium zhanjiangense TaxID=1325107 RepID=UPI001008FF65|nr:hypothetical protein [Bradyrhizobium zhanjiangense]